MNEHALLPLRLLLLGFGNVAQAFLPLLASRNEWLKQNLHIRPIISGIGTRSQGFYVHPTGIDAVALAQETAPFLHFSHQAERVRDALALIQAGNAAGASLLIELTTLNPQDGEPALTHIRTALSLGMDVITANKGPVAHQQAALQALAQNQQALFRFESTVLDGLPLINLAQFTLQAVNIYAFRALLNSTSTLVLSLIEQGHTFDEAIRQAQQLGIAEADPSYDLEGWDAVMKTTILTNNLLEGLLTPSMVQRTGVRGLSPDDIRDAARTGTPIRLVSRASRLAAGVQAIVSPERLNSDDILLTGKGSASVISLETEAMGTITLVEHDPEVQPSHSTIQHNNAAVLQTAYGVLSDLIVIMQQRQSRT
ncbi:MAG TPA: hypothetical protein VKY19_06625 [Ktedonosporobacter sp.]|jgi:homoserine dehydrogenase|nr:hypothetical protein [Ktedonosporobacter sp.]